MRPSAELRRPQLAATLRIVPNDSCDLSVVLPCLNEAETLETCIRKAQKSIGDLDLDGEVVVADNGSTDGSQQIATDLGARSAERAGARLRRCPPSRHR